MPRSVENLLGDVLRHIDLAERFISGKTYLTYANDDRLRLALERCLITIGEALSQAVRKHPDLIEDIADLHRAIALRNILVHAYFPIADVVAWSVLTEYLPAMREQAQAALEPFNDKLENE